MPTPIQLQNTGNLLSVIIVICFSFCIPILTYWFKNAEALPRLLGYSFIPVFLLNAAALFTSNTELSAVFSHISEPLLLLLITLLLAAKPEKKNFASFRALLICISATVFLTVVFSLPARTFLAQDLIPISASLITAAAIVYLLKNKKGDIKLLFWSILLLPASSFAEYYLIGGISVFVSPLLKLGAYTLLLEFFKCILLKSQLAKAEIAEKELARINRSIKYEIKERMLEIEKVNQNLVNMSKMDSMTKVMNKAALIDSIENLINRKTKSEFSILMFDIDNFKTINDSLGHVTGDKCLKTLSVIASGNIREVDYIGRYGGDEFIIVLPTLAENEARFVAERFRKKVNETSNPKFSISIGISTYPYDGQTVRELISAADKGLYKAKSKGKNTICHASLF